MESIRKRFAEEVEKNPNLYHPVDIERVKTEDYQVKRYLDDQNGDEDKAFELLCKSMQYKKEYKVHDRNDQFFPKEFWEFSGTEISGQDKQGRLVLMEVLKKQHSFKELAQLHREFVAYNLERVDRKAGEKGFVLVQDTNGAGASNIDMDLNKFKITSNDYYPNGLQQLYVVDLPWLLTPIMKVIVSFMSPKIQEKLVYCKKSELHKYVDPESLPVSLGGKRDKQSLPENIMSMEQCYEQLGLTDKFVDQYYSYYKLKRTK